MATPSKGPAVKLNMGRFTADLRGKLEELKAIQTADEKEKVRREQEWLDNAWKHGHFDYKGGNNYFINI